jgi:tetratricopeptide (TPR) repeat protein
MDTQDDILKRTGELFEDAAAKGDRVGLLLVREMSESLVKQYPTASNLWKNLGLVDRELGELTNVPRHFQNAIRWYEIALSYAPRDLTCFSQIGRLSLRLKDVTGEVHHMHKGLKAFEHVTSSLPNSFDAWLERGLAEFLTGEVNRDDLRFYQNAVVSLLKAADLDEKNSELWLYLYRSLSIVAVFTGEPDVFRKLVEICDRGLISFPESIDLQLGRTTGAMHLAIMSGDLNAVQVTGDQYKSILRKDEGNKDAIYGIANTSGIIGVKTNNVDLLKEAIYYHEQLPHHAESLILHRTRAWLGVHLSDASHLEKSIDSLNKINNAQTRGSVEYKFYLGFAYQNLAVLLRSELHHTEADRWLTEAIDMKPDWEYYGVRGNNWFYLFFLTKRIQHLESAIKDFSKLNDLNEHNGGGHENLARALVMHIERTGDIDHLKLIRPMSHFRRSHALDKNMPLLKYDFLGTITRYNINAGFFIKEFAWDNPYLLLDRFGKFIRECAEEYEDYVQFRSQLSDELTDKGNFELRYLSAVFEYLGGNSNKAFVLLDQLDRENEHDLRVQFYFCLTAFEVLHHHRFDIQENAVELALDEIKKPTSPEATYYAASILFHSERDVEAIEALSSLTDQWIPALFRLAEIYDARENVTGIEDLRAQVGRRLKSSDEIDQYLILNQVSLNQFFTETFHLAKHELTTKFIQSKEVSAGIASLGLDADRHHRTTTFEHLCKKLNLVEARKRDYHAMTDADAHALVELCKAEFPLLMKEFEINPPSDDVNFADRAYSILLKHYERRVVLLPKFLNLLLYRNQITPQQWVSLNLFFQLKFMYNQQVAIESRLHLKFMREVLQSLGDLVSILNVPSKIIKVIQMIAENEQLKVEVIKADYRYFKETITELLNDIPDDFLANRV